MTMETSISPYITPTPKNAAFPQCQVAHVLLADFKAPLLPADACSREGNKVLPYQREAAPWRMAVWATCSLEMSGNGYGVPKEHGFSGHVLFLVFEKELF